MELAYSEALRSVDRLRLGPGALPLNRLETLNRDLLAALPALAQSDALDLLQDSLRQLTGCKHVFLASSCRAAIAQVLALLPNKEVVIPAYTCGVVRTAVELAGKRVLYIDTAAQNVNSTSLEFARHAEAGRVLIPTHLFGIPTDIEKVTALAKQHGCITIEDAAAAVGARCSGRVLGTFGDIGVYSFERSKRFPAFRGAAILLNNENVIDPDRLRKADMFGARQAAPLREIAFALLYNVATFPPLYRKVVVPRQLQRYAAWMPGAGARSLKDEIQSPFYSRRFHPYQAALVRRMLARLPAIREKIERLVSVYQAVLSGSTAATFIPPDCDRGGLLRFPVAIPGISRAAALRLALERGLFLETNYEALLPDRSSHEAFPNALWNAQNVILLPLYTSLSEQDARQIAEEVVKIGSRR